MPHRDNWLAFRTLDRAIDNDVGDPAVLVGNIRAGLRVAIGGALRTDHDATEQPIARIRHHVTPIPHQRRRLPQEWIGVVRIDTAFTRCDRLIAGIIADVRTQGILRIERQPDGREGGPALLHLVGQI